MTQAELLQKIADKKNADAARANDSAAKAEKFTTFATGLKKLCDEHGFKDHDDFVQQMNAFAGVTVIKPKIAQAPDSENKKEKGTNKNGSPRKPKMKMTQGLCDQMKAYEESGKQSEKPTHEQFNVGEVTIEKYREARWDMNTAKENAKKQATARKNK